MSMVVLLLSFYFHAAGFQPGFAGVGGWGANHPTPQATAGHHSGE